MRPALLSLSIYQRYTHIKTFQWSFNITRALCGEAASPVLRAAIILSWLLDRNLEGKSPFLIFTKRERERLQSRAPGPMVARRRRATEREREDIPTSVTISQHVTLQPSLRLSISLISSSFNFPAASELETPLSFKHRRIVYIHVYTIQDEKQRFFSLSLLLCVAMTWKARFFFSVASSAYTHAAVNRQTVVKSRSVTTEPLSLLAARIYYIQRSWSGARE